MTQPDACRPVLVIDNRDSFVFNLARYLVRLANAHMHHSDDLNCCIFLFPKQLLATCGPSCKP